MAAGSSDSTKDTKKPEPKATPDVHKVGDFSTHATETATKLLKSTSVADSRQTLTADKLRKTENPALGGMHVESANGDTVTINNKGQISKVETAAGKDTLDIDWKDNKASTIKDKSGVWQSTDGVHFTLNGKTKILEINKSNFNVQFKDAPVNGNAAPNSAEPVAVTKAETKPLKQSAKRGPELPQWLDTSLEMGKSILAGAAVELNNIAQNVDNVLDRKPLVADGAYDFGRRSAASALAPIVASGPESQVSSPVEQAPAPGNTTAELPQPAAIASQPVEHAPSVANRPADQQAGVPPQEVAPPAIVAPPILDATTLEKTAQELHAALEKKEWFGLKSAPDTETITNLLEPLGQADRAALAKVYHADFDAKGSPDTLMNALKDKLGGDGSVDFRKAEAIMNRQDGRTNDAGALMVAMTDAKKDKEKGNAEIRAVFETLNSKQVAQLSQDFQKQYGQSYQAALNGADLTDGTKAALPYLEKGVDKKDAKDVEALANIAIDKKDPHLLAEALRGDSPAAIQARKELQNDANFKDKLADAFPSDSSVDAQENGLDPKTIPFADRVDKVALDYLQEGNISLATITSENTGKWIFDNKDNLNLAARNASDKERQDFTLGRAISAGTKPNDGSPADKEALDYYNKIHNAFKQGGNDREVSTWEDSLINGRSTIITDLANTHSDGGPFGIGKGENKQDIMSKAENLSEADWKLISDKTNGLAFRTELQDSLNTYADPGEAKRIMDLINLKAAAPDYAAAQKIHRSLQDTIDDNKSHVFLGMGTKYDGTNITQNITTLSADDAQKYKTNPDFRRTVDDFVNKNLNDDERLLAQRVLAGVAQDGKPPTLDATDTFLQDRIKGAPSDKLLNDAQAALKADPTLQASMNKPDGQLSASEKQIKADMQDAASSAYYNNNGSPYEGEYGAPQDDRIDTINKDLFSKGGLSLQDKLDLGYSTDSLIPDIAKASEQERAQLMPSLKPEEQQVVNAIVANHGVETLADKMRLYISGGDGNYADFKADLEKLNYSQVQALKNDYTAKYKSDLDSDYLAKVDPKERSQYESMLTPAASDGRQTFYDNLQKQLSDSGAAMDGSALTMQRSVDQASNSLESYQRIYQTLPKEKQEALDKFFNDSLEQRQQSKEKLAEIATTAAITAAALAAAPFTAGTSIALVAGIAFAAGAATKTVMTAAIEGNDFQWTPENLAKNVVMGGVSAALNFVGVGGIGALESISGKVASDVAEDVAVTSLKQGSEKVLQDGVMQLIAKSGKDLTEDEIRSLADRVVVSGATDEERAAVVQSIQKAVAAHASVIAALSTKVGQSALASLGREVVSSAAVGGSANAASELASAPFNKDGLDVKELITSTLTGMAMGAVMPIGLHAFIGARQLVAGVSRESTTIDGVTRDVAMVHPPKVGDPDFVIERGGTEIPMAPGSKPVVLQEGDRFKAADDALPEPAAPAKAEASPNAAASANSNTSPVPLSLAKADVSPDAVPPGKAVGPVRADAHPAAVEPAGADASSETVKPAKPESHISTITEDAGKAALEKPAIVDVNVDKLTDTKEITDAIRRGIADMHDGKPVTFHVDDTVNVPQLNDKGEVIMDGDKPKMISQGQLLYNELAKSMPERDFNFAKGGADFAALKPDVDVRLSTKESTMTLKSPVDVTTADGTTVNLPVGTKFSNGTILDGNKVRSADPKGEVWAQTPDGKLHQLTSEKVTETTIPNAAIENGNLVAGKNTLVLSAKDGASVKAADGSEIKLKQGTRLSNGAAVDADGHITTTDPSGKIYAIGPDGTRTELAAGTTINPGSLDHGQNLLYRVGFGNTPMNRQDDFINFDQTLKENNDSLGDGRYAPKAGATRDHFDLPDNVNVVANTAYGVQDIKGTEHFLMPNGFGNAGENVVLNYRGIPKTENGNFDLKSAKRLLKEFDDNHLAPPQALVDAVKAATEKAAIIDVSVDKLTDTKEITDAIRRGIADMHDGKPVTFHVDDTVNVPQLNDKGEVIMDGDKPKMISQGQLLYNELAKSMPERDFNFAKGGADFAALKPDVDVRLSTKESTMTLKSPVDVTTADGTTVNLPVGTKFSNGTILDGNKVRSADPKGEVWAQTPDGKLHQLTSEKVTETTIPNAAIENGNLVAGKNTLVLSAKDGASVKAADGSEIKLKQGTRLSNGAAVDADGHITTTDPSGKIYAIGPDGTRTELAAGTTINPGSLDHGQNLLYRVGFGNTPMNRQDDFINFDQTLKENNDSLGDGRYAPKAGATRDHFDLPDNVNVVANTAYGVQDIKGTEHFLMPNGFGNAGENVVLNYRGIPKTENGNFDLKSAKRLLKEFDDNHLAPPQALVDAVRVETARLKALNGPGYPDRAQIKPGSTWNNLDPSYAPPQYTAESVLKNDRAVNPTGWADPVDAAQSVNGKVTNFNSFENDIQLGSDGKPLNPMGPTGLADRGLLGNWGPNHAADPIVTRIGPDGKLQALLIVRKDTIREGSTGQLALPGGMVDRGEMVTATLKRELGEETATNLDFDNATPIYQGYVKDPRNTDNAWMETDARHLHVNDGAQIVPQAGDDAVAASWRTLDETTISSLYGDHEKLVRQAIISWEKETGRAVESDGTVIGGRVNDQGLRINARDQVLDHEGHPINEKGEIIDSNDNPIAQEFPNYSEDQKLLGRQNVESELAEWKTLDGKPVKQEFDSLASKLGMSQAQKDEILNGLAAVRDHGARIQGIDSEQVVNWNHTEREFGAAVQYAERNGLSKDESQNLLLAAMWSDGSKTKFNFTTHNLDGALAFGQFAKNNLKDFTPERVAQIQQAIREHQIAPPEFMSMIYGGAIMNAKPPLTEAQMKTLGGLRAKMANPFKPGTDLIDVPGGPAGAKALKLTTEEQALLQRSGQDYWFVPSPENSWNKVSRGLIDSDGIDNYAGPGGMSKIIKLRGPDKSPFFRDRSARFINPEDPSQISSQESWMRSQRDFLGDPEKGNFGAATDETRAYVKDLDKGLAQQVQAAQTRVDDWVNSVEGRKELNLPSPAEQPSVKIPGWTGTPEHPDLLNKDYIGNTPEELARARKIWDRYGDEFGREQRVDLKPMQPSYEPVMKPDLTKETSEVTPPQGDSAIANPSMESNFSGVYDGPMSAEEATRLNHELAAKQKAFNDSVDSILASKATDGEMLDKLRGIAFSDTAHDLSANSLMKLYTAFRDKGSRDDMIRLYDTTTNQKFKNSPFVREYLAVAYNQKGLASKSLAVVAGLEKDALNPANPRPELMNGEVYGAQAKAHVICRDKTEALISAVESGDAAKINSAREGYATAYDLAQDAPLPSVDQLKAQSHAELLQTRDAYTQGFHVNYEYYPGINAVYSNLALGDIKTASNLAELTRLATAREGGLERGNYWTSMTILESSLVSGADHSQIDATIAKIFSNKQITKVNLESTLGAWKNRVRPALVKLQSDPEQAAEATSMLQRFDYAETKLNEAIENPSALQKANEDIAPGDALIEKSHSYRGQSVYDTEVVTNNFAYGGIITDTSIARRDKFEFSKLLNAPVEDLMALVGGDASTLPASIGKHMRLSDIKDPEQFIAITQKLVRQNFGTEAKNLEVIDSVEHKLYYDHPIEALNKVSGIPAGRVAREGYDSRTSLSAEWAKGLGDCRHHAQAMQLLYDTWQGGRLNEYLHQAEVAANPAERAKAIEAFQDLERTQLRTVDVTVKAPIKVDALYAPTRPETATDLPANRSFIAADSINPVEEHTMNILIKRDAQDHLQSARLADSFYNQTYDFSDGIINATRSPDGTISFSGGNLDGVLGANDFKAPVTLQLAPFSGTRTKLAPNDFGGISERGLIVPNFDIMEMMRNRAQIQSQLMALSHDPG